MDGRFGCLTEEVETMKSEKDQKVERFVLSLMFFTAYMSLFVVAMESALGAVSHSVLNV
jgi:hypothetical protein